MITTSDFNLEVVAKSTWTRRVYLPSTFYELNIRAESAQIPRNQNLTGAGDDLKISKNRSQSVRNVRPRLTLRGNNGLQMTSNMFREYISDLEIDPGHEFILSVCSKQDGSHWVILLDP